jgi:glycerol-3-phosphate dehydrogenase
VSHDRAAHAISHYGTGAGDVLAFCRALPDKNVAGSGYTEAELRYLVRRDFARTLGDLLQRRTSLAISGALSSNAIAQATAVLSEELGWSSGKAAEEEAEFRALLARNHGLNQHVLTERDRKIGSPACA